MNKSTQQAIDELLKEQKADLKDKIEEIIDKRIMDHYQCVDGESCQAVHDLGLVKAEIARVFT